MKKLFYLILVKSGLYAWWSRVYQVLWDRRYLKRMNEKGYPIWRLHLTPKGASDLVGVIPYAHDKLKELGDAFHHPVVGDYLIGHILSLPDNGLDVNTVFDRAVIPGQVTDSDLAKVRVKYNHGESWDCDDAALWCAWAVQSGFNARVLNVVWKTGRWPWKTSGHNVCVCVEGGYYSHIGNWGRRNGFATINDVVTDILSCVGKTESDLVGWHIMDREQLTAKF